MIMQAQVDCGLVCVCTYGVVVEEEGGEDHGVVALRPLRLTPVVHAPQGTPAQRHPAYTMRQRGRGAYTLDEQGRASRSKPGLG